jgi:glucose-6-phosphate isomerase
MARIEPFASRIDLGAGTLEPAAAIIQRKLSDMRSAYADEAAVEQILAAEGDRLIYEVRAAGIDEVEGHIPHSTTVIQPGRVGDEFHMTKGHFHVKRDRAEIYLCLAGQGQLILQAEDGTVRTVAMERGTVAYVPPNWAHRTANTGDRPFAFFAAWPGDAGHDYGTIEASGFAKILVLRDGEAVLVDNPRRGGRP